MFISRGSAAPLAFALALASLLCLLSPDAGPSRSRPADRARSSMARRDARPAASTPAPTDPRALRSNPFGPGRTHWGESDLPAIEEDDSSDGESLDLLATAGVVAIPDRPPSSVARPSLPSGEIISLSRRSIVLRC